MLSACGAEQGWADYMDSL